MPVLVVLGGVLWLVRSDSSHEEKDGHGDHVDRDDYDDLSEDEMEEDRWERELRMEDEEDDDYILNDLNDKF